MTAKRLEQVRKAVQQKVMPESKKAEYARIFEIGANWADEHPKCPWIKLSEEKPQPKMRVIFLDNTGKAHFGSGNIAGDGAVVVGADGENMPILTHWMPIPKL